MGIELFTYKCNTYLLITYYVLGIVDSKLCTRNTAVNKTKSLSLWRICVWGRQKINTDKYMTQVVISAINIIKQYRSLGWLEVAMVRRRPSAEAALEASCEGWVPGGTAFQTTGEQGSCTELPGGLRAAQWTRRKRAMSEGQLSQDTVSPIRCPYFILREMENH